MNTTSPLTKNYAAEVLLSASCSDENLPVDILRLTITPEAARKSLSVMEWHSNQRLEADASLGLSSATLEVFSDFKVEAFEYCEDLSDDLAVELEMWGGRIFEAEPTRLDLAKLRFDGSYISLRAVPKYINAYISTTVGLTDKLRAIAEGRTPYTARVPLPGQ